MQFDWSIVPQTLLAAPSPGGQQASPPGMGNSFFFFLIAMIAIMYFFVLRPNTQRDRQRRQMLESLKKGDKVVTTGGILGTVVGADELKVVVRVSEEPVLKLEVLRSSIARVSNPEDTKDTGKK